jgi:hypothetical protein
MIKCFNKINVKDLQINSEFDYQSSDRIITLNDTGVNLSIEEINKIRILSEIEPIRSLHEEYYKICSILNINKNDTINWLPVLGKERCKSYTLNLLKEIKISSEYITNYHFEIFEKRKSLYENLTSVLDEKGTLLEVPLYDHSSVSGRTSIVKGFNFLTSSKEFRKNCKSINSEYLVSIDFKACEPNLYLRSIGKNIKNEDVYKHLMEELNIKVEDRSQLKRGILSVLYGASDETARKLLGGNFNLLEDIKEFFEIESSTKILQEEFDKNGYIFNMYGRPIFSDKSILNKWIQSSAVDFCSFAFLNFIQNQNLTAAYIIHDEMVVNCDKKDFENIKNIKKIQDSYTKIYLPVEISTL